MFSRERLLHPATAIATLALFVALGGVGYAAATVSNADIQAGAVSTSKLRDQAVITKKIAIRTVSASRIGQGAVVVGKVGAGAIATTNLTTGAVTTAKIAAGAVTGAQVAPNTIGTAQIADGAVVEGGGSVKGTRATLATGASNTALLTFAGLGTLRASCAAGITTLTFLNAAGQALDVNATVANRAGGPDAVTIVSSEVANGNTASAGVAGVNGVQTAQWQIALTPATGPARVLTAWTSARQSGTGCVVSAQVLDSATG